MPKNFDYLTIKGPGITGELVYQSALTVDFFAFADFQKVKCRLLLTPARAIRLYVYMSYRKTTSHRP
jgi:hypothetical protein